MILAPLIRNNLKSFPLPFFKPSLKMMKTSKFFSVLLLPRPSTASILCACSARVISRSTHSDQSTIDPAAVTHHSKLADEWWDLSGSLKALHSMNTLRVPLIRDGLLSTGIADPKNRNTPKPLAGVKIIDVGCGGGLLSEPLARLGAQVKGVDASAELIQVAQDHAKEDHCLDCTLSYEQTTAEEHVEKHPEFYDAVVSSEVIEHIKDKNFFVQECVKLLKPGGSIFMTTLNQTTISWLGAIVAAEQILRIVPAGTHDWNMFIAPHELQMILERHGCSTKLIHGMRYNPVRDEWCWSKGTDINYAIHAEKHKV